MDAKKYINYWHELRGEETVPLRANFNPMHMKQLLPYMLVLECTEAGQLQKRLTGSFLDSFVKLYYAGSGQIVNWPFSLKQQAAWKSLLTILLTKKSAGIVFEANVMTKETVFDTISGAFLPFMCQEDEKQLIGGIWPSNKNSKAYSTLVKSPLSIIETKLSIIPAPDTINKYDLKGDTFEYFKMRDDLIALAS
ncbi:PAS domain-containing protein [Kordiimonas sp. SCSIO 12610]|uniref:PAS domain-containing protein n=1 Tax=Kordiimonas sp. SCSIO 12610 TaxID=2829597 RepID=UPI00210CFDBA|nr:PAS domain-containing protein [Kordiimonas sp. SCSIO 12610]UTW55305.1 PAS domain-containing protein [Kordiimonas sp. SCSIO 12610]